MPVPQQCGRSQRAAAQLREAFAGPGVLESVYEAPFGTGPGAVLIHVRIVEVLVRGWDLTRATRQPAKSPTTSPNGPWPGPSSSSRHGTGPGALLRRRGPRPAGRARRGPPRRVSQPPRVTPDCSAYRSPAHGAQITLICSGRRRRTLRANAAPDRRVLARAREESSYSPCRMTYDPPLSASAVRNRRRLVVRWHTTLAAVMRSCDGR